MQRIALCLILSLSLLSLPVSEVTAEDLQTAKVYRDYPAYIAPPLCDNPRLNEDCEETEEVLSHSSSEAGGNFYLGSWAGLNALSSNDLKFELGSVDVEYEHGYGVALLLGYDYGALRVELEGSYRSNSVDSIKTSGAEFLSSDGDLEIQSLLLNFFYDIDTGSYITPYLGAGVGWSEVTLDGIEADGVSLIDDDDSVLSGQLAAGFQFALNSAAVFDVGYRFLMTDDLELEDSVLGKVETEVRSHLVAVGLGYKF